LLLKPGETCWRVETAGRFAVLMENDAYLKALKGALCAARRSVLVIGWNFDPRTRLDPLGDEGRADEVGLLLRRLTHRRPDLQVRMLIWRSPIPIALSQGFFPHRARQWFKRGFVELRLDRARPLGACHHQKIVVIDDKVAFTGGGDISTDRWDTDGHVHRDSRRRLPSGIPYPARHDVMTVMDGAAARALGDLARARWAEARAEPLEPVEVDGDPWPEHVAPDLLNVPVAISRTEPAWRGAAGVREIEHLHLASIAQARELILIENQYLTSPLIGAALAARLREPDGPEVVLISGFRAASWFDRATMDSARRSWLARLKRADAHGRLSAWGPLTDGGDPIIVHSKVALIDERFLRIGSANLNNRSAGFDTEVDVSVEAPQSGGQVGELVRRFRARLVSHYFGRKPDALESAWRETGSLGRAIAALGRETKKRLHPLDEPPTPVSRLIAEFQLGDPFTPADSWRPWRRTRLSAALRRSAPAIEDERREIEERARSKSLGS
jgi:phosphatidylserine/phosphatidylglycerophosphate/cardiolipin synthase-like enzyme